MNLRSSSLGSGMGCLALARMLGCLPWYLDETMLSGWQCGNGWWGCCWASGPCSSLDEPRPISPHCFSPHFTQLHKRHDIRHPHRTTVPKLLKTKTPNRGQRRKVLCACANRESPDAPRLSGPQFELLLLLLLFSLSCLLASALSNGRQLQKTSRVFSVVLMLLNHCYCITFKLLLKIHVFQIMFRFNFFDSKTSNTEEGRYI